MTTFDKTAGNLLGITPEDVAADSSLGFPRRIGFEVVERLQWRKGLRGITSSQINHFKESGESAPCAVSVVRDLQVAVDRDYEVNDPQPAKTEFSAEISCACGEVASVRVWFVVTDASVYGF